MGHNLLFYKNQAWQKTNGGSFDITMGGYAGAELCEAVGLYILAKLRENGVNGGLYRDDGLFMTHKAPRANEEEKKLICRLFEEEGLKVTIDTNLERVDFLDVSLDLTMGTYQPYAKPNSKVVYVHHQSNHPPSILKNIPVAVNKRISDLSQNEEIFKKHKDTYQTALTNGGYKFNLEYIPSQQKDQQKRTRSRKIIWFNPP